MNPEPQTEPQTRTAGWLISLLAYALTALVILVCAAIVVLPEAVSWSYLNWAHHHPGQSARYDPHHWLRKIALLITLATFAGAIWSKTCQSFRQGRALLITFGHWRRVFLPLPWERRASDLSEDDERRGKSMP